MPLNREDTCLDHQLWLEMGRLLSNLGDPLIGSGGPVFLDMEGRVPVKKMISPEFYCLCPHCMVRLEARTLVELKSKYLLHENGHLEKR